MTRPRYHNKDINLYVNNLDDDIDDERLRKEFSPFGTITSAKVMVREGRSEGYGFVCFTSPEEATKALEEMNGRTLGSKCLYVALNHRQQNTENRNLYVKNLDSTIDDDRLRKEFSPFGKITSAKVIMEMGRSKKFGFVCFSSPEEATKAITKMHGRVVGSKALYVALAQAKEDRRAQLTSQYMRRMATMRQQQMGYVPTIPAIQRFYGPMDMAHPTYVRPGGPGGCHCMPCMYGHPPLLNTYSVGAKASHQSTKITSTTLDQQSTKVSSTTSRQQGRSNVASTTITSGQEGVATHNKTRPVSFKYASNVRNVSQRSGTQETAAGRIQKAANEHGQKRIPTVCQESGCSCARLYKRH